MAVIFSDAGPDIRWVGNENGYADETNWSTVRDGAFYPGIPGVNDQLQHGHEDGDTWLPTEVNTSIRPGWFYHRDQDGKVKSLDQLIDNWYHSVGMNGNFLLNLPVDGRGLIHENEVARLMELKAYLDEAFSDNLVVGASAVEERSGYPAAGAVDGDLGTYWATDDAVNTASLTVTFAEESEANAVLLQEYIALGQRVRSFTVEADILGEWQRVATGTTIGNRRIVRFDPVTTTRLRITFDAKASVVISNVEAYRVP
ncbi:MAG: alpha-L-fucosidase [Rhodothermales bacterium]|jgi:alpha-L-fucosidase